MKVAVCISSELRFFDMCHKNIVNFFRNHDVDFFIHGWDNKTILRHGDEKNNNSYNMEDLSQAEMNLVSELYKPKKIKIEKKPHFDFPIAHSQFYSFHASHSLMEEYVEETNTRYDVVVKMRSDLIWDPRSSFHPGEFDPTTLYITHTGMNNGMGAVITLDRFFYGSPAIMKKMSGLYAANVESLGKIPVSDSLPEQFVYKYCSDNYILCTIHGMNENIVRIQSIGLDTIKDFDTIVNDCVKFYQ